MPFFFTILLLTLGIGFLYFGIIKYFSNRRILEEGNNAVATIIKIDRVEDHDPEHGKSVVFYPTYEYVDKDDKVCHYKPSETSNLVEYHLGKKVPITYHTGEINSVVILTRFGMYGTVFFAILCGFWIFSFGLYLLLSSGRLDAWIQ